MVVRACRLLVTGGRPVLLLIIMINKQLLPFYTFHAPEDTSRYLQLLRARDKLAPQAMTTNKQEKIDLERFGCSLRESTGVFCIDWRGRPATQAVNASIFALLARVSTEA